MIFFVLLLMGLINTSHCALVSLGNYTSRSGLPMQLDQLSVICDQGDQCEMGQNATFGGICEFNHYYLYLIFTKLR